MVVGQALTVAEKLKRNWIGVDINHLAIGLIEEKRLKPLKAKYEVKGFPKDLRQAELLAKEKPFEFEQWIVEYALKGHKTKKTGGWRLRRPYFLKVSKRRAESLLSGSERRGL